MKSEGMLAVEFTENYHQQNPGLHHLHGLL